MDMSAMKLPSDTRWRTSTIINSSTDLVCLRTMRRFLQKILSLLQTEVFHESIFKGNFDVFVVCHLLSLGIAAIIGPQSTSTSHHIQSICDNFEIPHIRTRWNVMAKKTQYSINLSPHPRTITKAFQDLVLKYKWRHFTILYEETESLIKLQELLKLPNEHHDVKIIVQQLDFSQKEKNM